MRFAVLRGVPALGKRRDDLCLVAFLKTTEHHGRYLSSSFKPNKQQSLLVSFSLSPANGIYVIDKNQSATRAL